MCTLLWRPVSYIIFTVQKFKAALMTVPQVGSGATRAIDLLPSSCAGAVHGALSEALQASANAAVVLRMADSRQPLAMTHSVSQTSMLSDEKENVLQGSQQSISPGPCPPSDVSALKDQLTKAQQELQVQCAV
jgi:hypothetical protein